MHSENQIEVPFNKQVIIGRLFSPLFFVLFSVYSFESKENIHPFALFAFGLFILFFGLIALLLIGKLSGKKKALIINSEGIDVNVGYPAYGLIAWSDIEDIQVARVMFIKSICITARNHEKYVNRSANWFTKMLMRLNYKSAGSRINFSTAILEMDIDQLHGVMLSKMREFKPSHKH